MEDKELKAVKINNAAWFPEIAEHIERFCQRAHVDGIQPGNLQTYFAQIAQGWYGKDTTEFWMVFEDEKPIAFASWQVLGLPHIAKVSCFAMHSWTKNKQAVNLLVEEYIRFGERWNARWWSVEFINKTMMRLFMVRAKKIGMEGKETQITNTIFRKAE